MREIKPPHIENLNNVYSVFLAGAIDLGMARNWQEEFANACSSLPDDLLLLNPRRNDWKNFEKENEIYYKQYLTEQIKWELDYLEQCDTIAMFIPGDSKAPVTLMELGIYARSGKLIVCCEEGFYRKDNVDMVIKHYGIERASSLYDLINSTITKYKKSKE